MLGIVRDTLQLGKIEDKEMNENAIKRILSLSVIHSRSFEDLDVAHKLQGYHSSNLRNSTASFLSLAKLVLVYHQWIH